MSFKDILAAVLSAADDEPVLLPAALAAFDRFVVPEQASGSAFPADGDDAGRRVRGADLRDA
jgi:hypothetical protein